MTDDSLVWDIIQFKYMILVIIIVFMNINFQKGDTQKTKIIAYSYNNGSVTGHTGVSSILVGIHFRGFRKKITIFRIRTSTFVPKNMLYRVLLSLDMHSISWIMCENVFN